MNLSQAILRACARFPERGVVHDLVAGAWRATPHARLAELLASATAALGRLDLPRGARIALVSESRAEWVALVGGAAALGLVVVPLDGALDAAALAARIAASDVRAVLASATLAPRVRAASPTSEVIVLDGWLDGPAPAPRSPASPVDPEAPALVLWTPGTTAPSKPVVLSQRALVAAARGMPPAILDLGDVLLTVLPLTHASGIATALAAVLAGRSLVLAAADDRTRLTEAFARFRPHGVAAVPAFFDRVAASVLARMEASSPALARVMRVAARSPLGDGPGLAPIKRRLFAGVVAALGGRLRAGLSGGEPLAEDTARFFNAVGLTVYEVYGSTETAGPVAMTAPGAYRLGTVGRPLTGLAVEVRDADPDGVGRLWVRGPTLLTPAGGPVAVLDTGDVGRVDARGLLQVIGRAEERLARPAGAVSTLEVERRLPPWPGVAERCACVVGEALVLVLVAADGADAQALLGAGVARCGALAPRLRPDEVAIAPGPLPRSSNLKVRKPLVVGGLAGAPRRRVGAQQDAR